MEKNLTTLDMMTDCYDNEFKIDESQLSYKFLEEAFN